MDDVPRHAHRRKLGLHGDVVAQRSEVGSRRHDYHGKRVVFCEVCGADVCLSVLVERVD